MGATTSTMTDSDNNIYTYTRILSMVLTVISLVVTMMVGIYATTSTVLQSQTYLTNTFLATYLPGPPSYTWKQSEYSSVTENVVTDILTCAKTARIFRDSCDIDNSTAFKNCIFDEFPRFEQCVNTIEHVTPLQTLLQGFSMCLRLSQDSGPVFTERVEISSVQQEILDHCFDLSQSPILSVLQDTTSPWYLASYNSAIVLFTASFIMTTFLVYTMLNPLALSSGAPINKKSDLVHMDGGYKLSVKDWKTTTTGIVATWAALIMAVILLILLIIFVWGSKTLTTYKYKINMTTQTTSLCICFCMLLIKYFALELWEKYFLYDEKKADYTHDKATDSHAQMSFASHTSSLQARPLTMRIPFLGIITGGSPSGSNTDTSKRSNGDALLLFPWAESSVFIDALLYISLLGMQPDNTTLEITQIFQSIIYASVLTVIFTYDYYEGYGDTKETPWIMSFCSNLGILFFHMIPLILVCIRLSNKPEGIIEPSIVAYAAIMFTLRVLYIIWHLVYNSPVFIGWSEVMWYIKLVVQMIIILVVIFQVKTYSSLNEDLKKNAEIWLVNYMK